MNQNANEICSTGANPPVVGASVWTSDKIDRHGQRGLSKGAGEFPMKLFELIWRPFCARRLRQNGPQKALPLQDEAEAAWAEAEELQRRLRAEQEENRRQAIRLQQREAELHSATAELDALRRALAALAPSDYEAVYTLLAPELDPNGFHLFRAAEIYTGCNVYRAFPVEDRLGYFEAMSGHELLRWLEAEAIGSYSLSRLSSGVEVACDLRVDQSGEEYRRYHAEICKLAVEKILCMK